MVNIRNVLKGKIFKRLVKKEVRKALRPALNGKFGEGNRRKAFFYLLGNFDKRKATDNDCKAEIELINRYDKIIIRPARSERIGEFIPRYLLDVYEAKDPKNSNVKFVYIPMDYDRMNSRLSEVFYRNEDIILVKKEDVYKWRYLSKKYNKIILDYRNPYSERSCYRIPPEISKEFAIPLMSLDESEIKEAEGLFFNAGIRSPFICISNRDVAYMTREYGRDLLSNIRNSHSSTRRKAIGYLNSNNILSVRMGREVLDQYNFEGCIDYASNYYNELLDLYLSYNCKFFVADSSGINALSVCYGRPNIMTNDPTPHNDAWSGYSQNPNESPNLMIFKKFFFKEEDRFLNINEMIKLQWANIGGMLHYPDYGIELIENTEEEIYDVVKEMNERIDGTWVETEEDEALQKKYWDIVYSWYDRAGPPFARHNAFVGRIGAKFLRENQYLFDIDKVSPAWEKKFEGVEYRFPVKELNA